MKVVFHEVGINVTYVFRLGYHTRRDQCDLRKAEPDWLDRGHAHTRGDKIV